MWLKFEETKQVKLKDPALLVALSTSVPQYRALYSQARELANYMLKKMNFKQVATIYSSSFAPEVIVRGNGVAELPTCRFYVNKGARDILLLAGDASPMDDQYNFAKLVLVYAQKSGVKEVFSVGARWSENPTSAFSDPELNGFATDQASAGRLKKHGVTLIKNEPAPFFASMVVAMAGARSMKGYKISVDHGEPSPHTRAVVKMLEALMELMGFQVSLEELKSEIKAPPSMRPSDESSIYH